MDGMRSDMKEKEAKNTVVNLVTPVDNASTVTRRDIIAAAVLSQFGRGLPPDKAARQAVEYTDALIKELNK
jgi:fructose-1-phosphate kinase PfkB-like protein